MTGVVGTPLAGGTGVLGGSGGSGRSGSGAEVLFTVASNIVLKLSGSPVATATGPVGGLVWSPVDEGVTGADTLDLLLLSPVAEQFDTAEYDPLVADDLASEIFDSLSLAPDAEQFDTGEYDPLVTDDVTTAIS